MGDSVPDFIAYEDLSVAARKANQPGSQTTAFVGSDYVRIATPVDSP